MKKHRCFTRAIAGAVILIAAAPAVPAQTQKIQEADTVHIYITERDLDGPRMGITFIPGNGELADGLKDRGIGRTISQFGWHFEHRVRFQRNGPAFVIEFVPLIAGVEYGKFIPSASLLFGLRLPNGFEVGMGPNIMAGGDNGAVSALVLALGKTFDYAGVSIPINLAYVTSPIGNRIGLIFGYAL